MSRAFAVARRMFLGHLDHMHPRSRKLTGYLATKIPAASSDNLSDGRRAVLLWESIAGLAVGLAGAAGVFRAWSRRRAGES